MAKVTDLHRALVLESLNGLTDQKRNRFFHPSSWSDLKIKFGKENRHGVAPAQVIIKIYNGSWFTYTFDLIFDFVMEDWGGCCCKFKSLTIDKEFSCSHLISFTNFKLNGLWQEEEEEAGDVVPAIVSPVEVSDGNLKSVIL